MRVLIYGLNCAPELTGVGKYTGETAYWLASQGHEVRVVTAPPYYPDWKIAGGYRNVYQIEEPEGHGGLRIYRCPLWIPIDPNGFSRLIHLWSFATSTAPAMAMQVFWKPEVVFTVQPTLFIAPAALLVAGLTAAKSWLHIQDFEVDAAFDIAGLLPKLQPLAKVLERSVTGAFSKVSTISEKMLDQLAARGATREDATLFPNWSDVDGVRSELPGADNHFRDELSLGEKIVLLYSGSMGAKQGLEVLALLAESFAHDPHVHFVFCGDGPSKPELQRLVARSRNVTMLSLQSKERLNSLLNAADIHLLPQSPEVRDQVMPSKLCGILSSGRPVLALAEQGTQVARVVEGRGLVVPPSDFAAMYAAARRLVDDPGLRAQLGHAGREYAVMNLAKEDVLRRFEKDLIALVTSRKNREEIQLARGYRG